jgi:hypothetical protein
MREGFIAFLIVELSMADRAHPQTNSLWHEETIKSYLPHMTSPENERQALIRNS